ncbi:beta and beta-prime subunits of DNA dependent RNA-polymerase [Hortaea werneckii]|nr:beta and beta-prime subunits of DNA dependent RNA-polymerase [Hortaea werneckii]KAI7417536.1 beta and beta-prime subunits of DNA dependent RNA-polymerase [Hortaea werneckii]KAI7445179.1 beta and beta-prime subunits of DNA dependent RNA-polymerase [Hortaea werneckii]KAI7451949.1 beta and beta-prime subunits of DNA dependent RNA-polymerase [Hortaea werneckii]
MATTTETETEDVYEAAAKEQVLDQVPKRINALQFGILSPPEIVSQSVVNVLDRNLYDIGTLPGQPRGLTKHGPNDERLGTSAKTGSCQTCGQGLKECNGHFGHVKLSLPVFHYGYFRKIIETLNCVCKDCSRVLLPEKEKRAALKQLRRPGLDMLRKGAIIKKIAGDCRKVKVCPHCSGFNGPVKKVPGHPIKMIHAKYAIYTSSNAKNKKKPEEMQQFEQSFETAKKSSNEIDRHMRRAVDDLTPLRALNILKKIPDVEVELVGMDPHRGGRPEHMLWTHVPAPPVALRPSVAQEAASTEDDITNKLGDIIQINNYLRAALSTGQPIAKVMEMWEFLQVQVAMYIDGNLPGLGKDSAYGKMMRGFCQRLKGKQGRFRGNLSGKRVDFSGRTVISPDPNLSVEEVAVPVRVAKHMTYPEKVTKHNLKKLKQCVLNGEGKHPGANAVIKARGGHRIILRVVALKGNLNKIADKLEYGDTVERHLEDGDVVLFNRQPSLHKLSILSHKAKVRPWRTFRLNECVCNPYNADFDGDEMNLHVPQTEEARTEAIELMGVKNNLATPKNGTPIISAIQDFITGAFLVSEKDRFFTRQQFCQIVGYMFDGLVVKDPGTGVEHPVELPPPALMKPQALWTGKQVWSVLMKPHSKYPVNVNLDAKGKQFKAPPKGEAPDMGINDGYLVVRNSEVMCGVMDKAIVGDGKKDSVFYVIMRDYGPEYAAVAMNRLAKLSSRWLTNIGFSIGISDVYPSMKLRQEKDEKVRIAYAKCADLINLFMSGKLQRDPGCDEEMTMENQISGILSKVRQECGDVCFAELSRYNAPLTMAKCGSKGSNINVSQMVAAVGQQIIGGKRVLDGFQDRTLPHFSKASRDPPAKGFVFNSFFSGLNPTEFIFHAMSGREGLVDTAVKTAETGYMSRRLMKSLEDLSANYDNTVRNSEEGVVQMKFGDDGLDPVDMEGSAKPVNFERTFMHSLTTTWDNTERGLLPDEIQTIVAETLDAERAKLKRFGDDGQELPLRDTSDSGVDQLESARNFLDTVQVFLNTKVNQLVSTLERFKDSEYGVFKITETALRRFLALCLRKFEKSKTEAGHAVGAVGAQSIGEPGTQMTLKTFHFAGVAGMSITQGVPRIKEIINASKTISTPVITCALDSKYEEIAGRFAKAIIQKTYLKDIVAYVEDVWFVDGCYLNMRVDWRTVRDLGLRIHLGQIAEAIEKHKGFKQLNVTANPSGSCHIRVHCEPPTGNDPKAKRARGVITKNNKLGENSNEVTDELFMTMQNLKRRLPDVVIKGYPDAHRAILKKDDKKDATGREPIAVFVEGYGFKLCMTTEGVDGYHTTTNSIMEVRDVLGIEAARSSIISEISAVMGGMDIDPRHMQLLADVMTYKGDILGITRFGLAKMRDSVLQLASFEKTPDHLFEAAVRMKKDEIRGVSECIIMGQSMSVGTGAMSVVRPLGITEEDVRPRVEGVGGGSGGKVFKGAWREKVGGRKARLRGLRNGLVGAGGAASIAAPAA